MPPHWATGCRSNWLCHSVYVPPHWGTGCRSNWLYHYSCTCRHTGLQVAGPTGCVIETVVRAATMGYRSQVQLVVSLRQLCMPPQWATGRRSNWLCHYSCTCRHTGLQVAHQTDCVTQTRYTYIGPASPSAGPVTTMLSCWLRRLFALVNRCSPLPSVSRSLLRRVNAGVKGLQRDFKCVFSCFFWPPSSHYSVPVLGGNGSDIAGNDPQSLTLDTDALPPGH